MEMEDVDDRESDSTPKQATSLQLCRTHWQKAKRLIIEHFLLVAFSVAILVALSIPDPGILIGSYELMDKGIVSFINTFIVFFISGITLKLEEFRDVSKYIKALSFGIVSILFLTTLIAPIFLSCSFLNFQYQLGLAIFCCVPTTLGVGVTLTQSSSGDVLLSLLLTVITNALGTVTTPFLLMFYLSEVSSGDQNNLKFDSIGLLINLSLNVLLPTILAITLRYLFLPQIKRWTKDFKTELSMFSTTNLAMIIWMALSKSREKLFQQSVGDIFIVLVCGIVQHVFYLLVHYGLVCQQYCFQLETSQAISVIIMCSQKSNPVALAVINGMGLKSSESGLVIIPGLLGQLCQIFIGSALVRFFQQWSKRHVALPTTETKASLELQEFTDDNNNEEGREEEENDEDERIVESRVKCEGEATDRPDSSANNNQWGLLPVDIDVLL